MRKRKTIVHTNLFEEKKEVSRLNSHLEKILWGQSLYQKKIKDKKKAHAATKRKLALRCPTITECIIQVRTFRRIATSNLTPIVNLNSTYVIHSRFELAEVLKPGFAAFCDSKQYGSDDACKLAKEIILAVGTVEQKTKILLGKSARSKTLQPLLHPESIKPKTVSKPPVCESGQVFSEWSLCTSRPLHPVVYGDNNLCSLSITGNLHLLSLITLKRIFQTLNLNIVRYDEDVKLTKDHYIEQLDVYLKLCSCRFHGSCDYTHSYSFASTNRTASCPVGGLL